MKRHKAFYSRGQKLTELALRANINENIQEKSTPMTTLLPTTCYGEAWEGNETTINKDNSLLPDLSLTDMSIGSTLPDLNFADMSIGSTSYTCLDSGLIFHTQSQILEKKNEETDKSNLTEKQSENLSTSVTSINIFTDNEDHYGTLDNRDTSIQNDGIDASIFSNNPCVTAEPMAENRCSVSESIENMIQENRPDQTSIINEIQYTKKGTVRKRKKYALKLDERKKTKKDAIAESHSVKPACNLESCKKKCLSKITEGRRSVINKAYWGMKTESERKTFILNNVACTDIKQRTVIVENNVFYRKQNYQIINSLKDEKDASQVVCKAFFMATLGYKSSSDKFMRIAKEKSDNVVPPIDKRSIREPHNKYDYQLIRQHILEFEPSVSHHRREHAPYRSYLPSDLSFTSLHKDFNEKHPQIKCSYEKYRVYAREVMKISIVNLGHEECDKCEEFRLHNKIHSKENLEPDCKSCQNWKIHNHKAKQSRLAYKIDAEKEWEEHVAVYSVDLQKVIMLPRMDMFKSAIFVQRLTAFNESFVPVGKNKLSRQNQVMAVLWHEAISGRNKEDLISTFYKFLICHREDKKIILWVDNCTAQNKNWALFSFFIYMMNTNEINAEEIIIKYFEPGHSFMSADSFHHRVELSMKRAGGEIYDFQDFCQAVEQSSKHVDVKSLTYEDFYTWEDYSSQHRLKKLNPRPFLRDMVEVSFRKGCLSMLYKKSFDGELLEVNFVMAKFEKNGHLPGPKSNTKPKGIPKEKKDNLIKVLEPIILKNRMKFWKDLPES